MTPKKKAAATKGDAPQTPTQRWLAAVPDLPPVDGTLAVAERLLLLLHYSVDFDSWVGSYIKRYWSDLLPDRVIVATYRAGTLHQWWDDVAAEFNADPRGREERLELAQLLAHPEPQAVLEHLRVETTALLLRTRITADAVRSTRAHTPTNED